MKIKTMKTSAVSLLIHIMWASVIISHAHAKDAIALARANSLQPGSVTSTQLTASDIHTKALSDLHHHIDKTSVKNMSMQTSSYARRRELKPQPEDIEPTTLGQRFYEFMLRLRVVISLMASC